MLRPVLLVFFTAAVFYFSWSADVFAQSDPPRLSLVELQPELAMSSFENDAGQTVHTLDAYAHVGLAWAGWKYVTLRGFLGLGGSVQLESPFAYRYHNSTKTSIAAALLSVRFDINIHPAGRRLYFDAAARAQTGFLPGRSGFNTIFVGLGAGAQPFFHADNSLRAVAFGFMIWHAVLDDYKTIFGLSREWLTVSFSVSFLW